MENEHIFIRPQIGNIPSARLTDQETAKVLGFQPHEIPVLVAKKLLIPLGKPRANAPKYFAYSDVFSRANDSEWLSKATQAVYGYNRMRNQRRSGNGDSSEPSSN